MISSNAITQIAKLFCGDIEGFFSYKTGSKLVNFFNGYFNCNDSYRPGFPSRWQYTYDKIIDIINENKFNDFINVILSENFIRNDLNLDHVGFIGHRSKLITKFNEILSNDLYVIINRNNKYLICKEDTDLEYLGTGGFANVYVQKSTGHVLKKLKDDYLMDKGVRSRFKREFEITKSLGNEYGIIRVFLYDDKNYSYTMEKAEITLYDYINNNELNEHIKLNCIMQILYIMSIVHEKNIIHRDLSPTNIFLLSGKIIIADFGLGKDLNVLTSHQTIHTNSMGQFAYCAPEQFMLLREGDKRSDVYSMGRIINFIMTKNPFNLNHVYRNICEKATNENSIHRYADIRQLNIYFKKAIEFNKNKEIEKQVMENIQKGVYNDDVETYIYQLNSKKLTAFLTKKDEKFINTLIKFMSIDNNKSRYIIEKVDSICNQGTLSFSEYDGFALFSYKVLLEAFPFDVLEIAANVLRYVAFVVNRYYAQNFIADLKRIGIDPMIEDVLNS